MAIEEQLAKLQSRFSGQFVLYAEHLTTGEILSYGEVHPMETASTIKIPILAEVMRQIDNHVLELDMPLTLHTGDFVSGSGVLQHLTPGTVLSLKDVLTLMVIVSDNVATNMVLRLIGLSTVNTTMKRWGLHNTELKKRIDFALPGPLGLSTPEDLVTLLKGIYQKTLLTPASCQLVLDMLTHQQVNILLTRHLPYALLSADEDNTPPEVIVASKSGSLKGVRNDMGLVLSPWGDYAIALMSESCRDHRFHPDNEAQVLLPRVSELVFRHFFPDAP